MAQMVVNSGGIGATVEYLKFHRGPAAVPGHMILGYLASHSETVAAAIILAKVAHTYQTASNISFNWIKLYLLLK